MIEPGISSKSRLVCFLLCLFPVLGFLGVHRYYAGKVGTGLLMLVTLGGLGVWWLIDLIFIGCGSFRDKNGKLIKNWLESN
ncbi:MAG: TM2 domain-containing protein [Candidatus Omnitrophica bacterium]|nr:TM2 domain-containing protein [Candidatus Omnitrophota bacterium]